PGAGDERGNGPPRATPRARRRCGGGGSGAGRSRPRAPARDRRAPAGRRRLLGRGDGPADDGRLPPPAPGHPRSCDRGRRLSGSAWVPREAAGRPLRGRARAAHPGARAPAALPALREIAALGTRLPHARALRGLRAPLRARAGVLRRRHLHQLRRDGRRGGGGCACGRRARRADARRAAGARRGARGAGPARLLPLCPEPVAVARLPGDDGGRAAGAGTAPLTLSGPALEVADLRHRYGERIALDGVSLSVEGGELFGLLGPNGGGKSTLFRILSTLLVASSGTARVRGLDPAARREFLAFLAELRAAERITVVLTTHDMEEAERCGRVAILDRGRVVALGTPEALKARVGGDVLVVVGPDPARLAERVRERFGLAGRLVDGTLRLERERGHELVRDLIEAFPEEVRAVSYGKPTLDDVFIQLTGHRLAEA